MGITTPAFRLTVWLGLLALTVLGYAYGRDQEVLSRDVWVFDPNKPYRLRVVDVSAMDGFRYGIMIGATGEARFYRRDYRDIFESAAVHLSSAQVREIGWAVEAHQLQRAKAFYQSPGVWDGGWTIFFLRQSGREQLIRLMNYHLISLDYFRIYLDDVIAWTTPELVWAPIDRPIWEHKSEWDF